MFQIIDHTQQAAMADPGMAAIMKKCKECLPGEVIFSINSFARDEDDDAVAGEGEEQCDYPENRAAWQNLEEGDQAETSRSCEHEDEK